jgi:acetyl esterase/lipase
MEKIRRFLYKNNKKTHVLVPRVIRDMVDRYTISHDPSIFAHLYLPTLHQTAAQNQKLPILVYFHDGGFCIETSILQILQTRCRCEG